MGYLEKESRKRARRANLKYIVLKTISVVGVMSVAVLAPNALRAMDELGIIPMKRQREYIRSARERLLRSGLIKRTTGGYLEITAKGEAALRKLELTNYKIEAPKKWDEKWRMLIFDIPERQRRKRDSIRSLLVAMGFMRLQDSVWVYPYPCEEVIELLKVELGLNKELLYVIVDSLDGEKAARKYFGL